MKLKRKGSSKLFTNNPFLYNLYTTDNNLYFFLVLLRYMVPATY